MSFLDDEFIVSRVGFELVALWRSLWDYLQYARFGLLPVCPSCHLCLYLVSLLEFGLEPIQFARHAQRHVVITVHELNGSAFAMVKERWVSSSSRESELLEVLAQRFLSFSCSATGSVQAYVEPPGFVLLSGAY